MLRSAQEKKALLAILYLLLGGQREGHNADAGKEFRLFRTLRQSSEILDIQEEVFAVD